MRPSFVAQCSNTLHFPRCTKKQCLFANPQLAGASCSFCTAPVLGMSLLTLLLFQWFKFWLVLDYLSHVGFYEYRWLGPVSGFGSSVLPQWNSFLPRKLRCELSQSSGSCGLLCIMCESSHTCDVRVRRPPSRPRGRVSLGPKSVPIDPGSPRAGQMARPRQDMWMHPQQFGASAIVTSLCGPDGGEINFLFACIGVRRRSWVKFPPPPSKQVKRKKCIYCCRRGRRNKITYTARAPA